jgi:hypothetical protein
MGRSKDKAKRSRRKKTDQEKEATRRKKEADQRAKDQQKHGSISTFVRRDGQLNDNSNSLEEHDDTNASIDNSDEAVPENNNMFDDDEIVIFSEDVDAGSDENDPVISANLDIDEEAYSNDELDEEAEAEADNAPPTKVKHGVHLDYMRAIQDRVKKEVAGKTKGFEMTWLLNHLKINDGWVRKEQAQNTIRMLTSSKHSPSTCTDAKIKWRNQDRAYYRDIKVWLPDILLLGGCHPFCPTCKSNNNVSRHGFNKNHVGRVIIGLTENYYIMTCRYICTILHVSRSAKS